MGSSKKVTVGYKYLLGMHMVLCHGPIDRISKIRWDGRDGWTGSSEGGEIEVDAEDLFGGKSREGGVSGLIDFEQGLPTQGRNSYLQSVLGSLIPAFRGVAALVLKRCYLGMNPYLKPISVVAQRVHVRQDGLAQWYDEKAQIGSLVSKPLALYFALDLSGSMDTITSNGLSRLANMKTAVNGALDYVATLIAQPGTPIIDIIVVGWGSDPSSRTSILRRAVDAADIAAIKSWVSARTADYFTYFPAGLIDMSSFFAGAPADSVHQVFFVTDGEPSTVGGTMTAQAIADAAAALVDAQPGAKVYGINIDLSDTQYTAIVDNTPSDGVPVVSGADPDALSRIIINTLGGHLALNPAHIIRECNTDPDWGMGYPEDSINDASFEACADQLYSEGMGMSLMWDRQQPIEEFVQVVCNHIDATHYVDRNGKWTLKLIRDDYDEGALITLDPSNVDRIENPSRPGFGELVNSVTVNYVDGTTFKTGSITVGDPALSQAQGVVINTTLQYPGFFSETLAARVASRDLRALSTPLFSCVLYANREASELQPGDVFKLTWPAYDLVELVMRITGIALGDGRSNQVRISCVEDVFAVPAAAVQSPGAGGGWQDPSQTPLASPAVLAFEVPYYELVQVGGQTSVDADLLARPESGFVGAAAVRPAGSAVNAAIYTDSGAGFAEEGTLDFCPSATLQASIDREDTVVDLLGDVDLDLVTPGTHAQIGAELVAVDGIAGATMTIRRGVLDTVPVLHAAGARVYFWDEYSGAAGTEYLDGESVGVRVLPINGTGVLPLNDATTETVVLGARAARPYPPGNVAINGEYWPPVVEDVVNVTWSHRDRLQQTAGTLIDFTDGDIGPEAGTTYTLRLLRADTDALLDEVTGVTVTTQALSTFYSGNVYAQLWSVRDGLSSWQIHEHTFSFLLGAGQEGFSYNKSHTIAGTASGAQTDFQMRVVVHAGSGTDSGEDVYLNGHVQADFDDVRFTSAGGTTALSYWKDQSTLDSGVSCVFWVKIPAIPASPGTVDIRLYYGNPLATDASDIQATMLGGDDFRSMRKSWQVNGGAGPRWGTGITKTTSGDVYMAVWDSGTTQHWLYKTTDGGRTAPTLVSTIWAASSGRSHSNLTTNGSTNFYAVSRTSSGIYFKKSTDTGATWGSEVTLLSGATSVADPVPVYISSALLWVFVRVTSGANYEIRCYESTNDGASFALKNTPYTVASAGINAVEDLDVAHLTSGRVLIAWERETTEKGEARCDYVYSDDNCSTYASVATIVNSTGTVDDEGGSFAIAPDGTLDYFFGSNRGGGASYLNQQVWRTRYDEMAGTWSTPELFNGSYGGVENNAMYVDDGNLLLLATRHYDATNGVDSTYMLTMTRVGGDDLSDRGWTQDLGIAYVLDGGMWVEGWQVTTVTRAFLPYGGYTGGDSVIEALVSAPDPLTDVDCRIVFRYGSATNHYMLSLLKSTSNNLQWYKMVSGTYTLLHQATITPAINTLYRIIVTLRGTNPTTLTAAVNGTTILNAVTEATSTQTTGKIGLAAGNQITRRAHMARHIFARKYVAVEPTHGAWGAES